MYPRRLAVVILTALIACALSTGTASAHAELIGSDPPAGARLATMPEQLTLTFSEAVSVRQSSVRLDSHALRINSPSGRPKVLVADTTAIGSPLSGTLTLAWRSVSADDGHVATGTFHFRVGGVTVSPSPAPQVAPPVDETLVKDILLADRLVGYLGLALFVGGLAFLSILWPGGIADRRIGRVLTGAWIAGATTTVAAVGLQGAYAGGLPLSAATRSDVIGQVLDTHVGEIWAAKALLWVLAAIVLSWALHDGRSVAAPAWRAAALAIGAGLLRTTGMTAHAVDTAHPAWSQTADFLHLTGVSAWLGGLVVLLIGLLRRRRPGELAEVLPRYSRYALASVLLIAGSGLFMAWQLIGSVSALFATSYGHLLLIKLAVLAGVLAAAQRSKAWVADRLDLAVLLRGDARVVRPVLLSVAAETTLLLVVVSVATLLVTAAPGR